MKVVFRGNRLGLRCLRFLLLEVICAIHVIRGKKLPISKIFCNAAQNFPKEKIKPGSTPDGGKPPEAEKMKGNRNVKQVKGFGGGNTFEVQITYNLITIRGH
jgi:hypothetical protein